MPLFRFLQPKLDIRIPEPQDMRHIHAELGLIVDSIHSIDWRDGNMTSVNFTEAAMNGRNVELVIEIGEMLYNRYGIHYCFVMEG